MAHTFGGKQRIPVTANTTSTANPLAANVTLGAGTTVMVVALIYAGSTVRGGGAPTYNAVALTQADTFHKGTTSPECSCEIWYMPDPPTGSAYSLSIPNSGAVAMEANVSWYSAGSGKTSALDAVHGLNGASSVNPTDSITTIAANCLIVSAVADGAQTWAPTPQSGTVIYNDDNGNWGGGSQYTLDAGAAGAKSYSWTFGTSEDWGVVAVSLKTTSQPVAVGQTSEVESVTAVLWRPKNRSAKQTAETDSVQAVARVKYKAIGIQAETESVFSIVPYKAKNIAVGQVGETDTTAAVGKLKQRSTGQVAETDAPQVITPTKIRIVAVGQVGETELAQHLSSRKTRAIGQTNETELAQSVSITKQLLIGQITEIDLAQLLVKTVHIGQVQEIDSAQEITYIPSGNVEVGQVIETDLALPFVKQYWMGQVVETDLALAVLHALNKPIRRKAGDKSHRQEISANKQETMHEIQMAINQTQQMRNQLAGQQRPYKDRKRPKWHLH
jgi:hypothetical protein